MSEGLGDVMAELRRRVETRRRAGDYDLAWLDEPVLPVEPVTPVDRYLQAPPRPAPDLRHPRASWRMIRDHRARNDALLREAVTWLALALQAERGARESLAVELREANQRLLDQEERIGRRDDTAPTPGEAA